MCESVELACGQLKTGTGAQTSSLGWTWSSVCGSRPGHGCGWNRLCGDLKGEQRPRGLDRKKSNHLGEEAKRWNSSQGRKMERVWVPGYITTHCYLKNALWPDFTNLVGFPQMIQSREQDSSVEAPGKCISTAITVCPWIQAQSVHKINVTASFCTYVLSMCDVDWLHPHPWVAPPWDSRQCSLFNDRNGSSRFYRCP